MKVVVVTDKALFTGGAMKVAVQSSIALANRGVPVHIFAGNDHVDRVAEDVPNLTFTCIDTKPIHDVKGRWQKLPFCIHNAEADSALARTLSEFSPKDTIVHFHMYGERLLGGVVAMSKRMGFKTVMTCHDYGIACPVHIFYDFPKASVCHLRPLSLECIGNPCTENGLGYKGPKVTQKLANRYLYRVNESFDAVLYVSEFSREILAPFVPSATLQRVLRNPCDIYKGEPAKVSQYSSFLFAGRLVREKGPVILAQAARIAGLPVRFCGEGAERDAILRANPDAEITGWVDQQAVYENMRRARALVIASIWLEASPLVTVEALSMGLPVISSDACASREAIENGVTGLTFCSGDPEDLAQKMTALNDPTFAAQLGQNAYDRLWSDPPTLDAHVDSLLDLYHKLLSLN